MGIFESNAMLVIVVSQFQSVFNFRPQPVDHRAPFFDGVAGSGKFQKANMGQSR